jgi:hypothetical protein
MGIAGLAMPWPMEKGGVVNGTQKQMSIRPKVSSASPVIQAIETIILRKEIPSRRQSEMTWAAPCIPVKTAITEARIRKRPDIDTPSPHVI